MAASPPSDASSNEAGSGTNRPSGSDSSTHESSSAAPSDPEARASYDLALDRLDASAEERMSALDAHDLPVSSTSEAFERIARLATFAFDVPVALVTFIGKDWQWIQAHAGEDLEGTDIEGTPVGTSFCMYTVQDDTAMVVEDARKDPRFQNNPFVVGGPEVRFYAGYPLETAEGVRVGTLCLLDTEPRSFDAAEQEKLRQMAMMAVDAMALRRSLREREAVEQRLSGILQTSVAAILVLSRDGTVVYLNERTRNLLQPHQGDGMHAQVESRHFRDLDVEICSGGGETIELEEEGTLNRVVETGEPVFGVRRELRWPTGRRQTISLNAAPLCDEQGNVREVVFSMEDVTERRYAESLRRRQRRILEQIANGTDLDVVLHSIVEMMEDLRPSLKASVLLVEDGRLHHGAAPSLPEAFIEKIDGVKIGPGVGACGTAAHRGEEVLSSSIQDDPRWNGYKEIAAEHNLRACWSIPLWNDGQEVIGTLAFYWPRRQRPDERDEQLARTAAKLAGIAIDRDLSERELRESEAHFRQLAENIEEVFWLRTREEMLYVSPAFETISGRSREALCGDPSILIDIVHPDDAERVREAYERGWEEGEESDGPLFDEEYRIMRPSGEVRWVHSVAWSYTIDDDGELRQAGYAVDVTEQVERRQELVAAKQEAEELNRLKTAFLANMSHEIRTPLTSIIGFAEILQDELGDEHGRAPELIHSAGERLMSTLDSVLQLSRLEADSIRLRPKELDVCEEARETMLLFEQQAEKSDVALSIETLSPPQMACADPSALQRVLQNLIGNAVKFTEEGRVTVRVAPAAPPDERAASGDAEWVCVKVEDTGVGISEDFLPNVYEAFEQESTGTRRSHEGSGLGLTVVKRLVDLMDGVVDVESERSEGTTFRVYLPGKCREG